MKKRFIAGAVCPKCAAIDSIVAVDDIKNKVRIRECVDCGFSDRISTIVNSPQEIETRVSASAVQVGFDKIEVIKILK